MIRRHLNNKDSEAQTGDALVDNILDEFDVKYFGTEPKDEIDQKEVYGYITNLESGLVKGIVNIDNDRKEKLEKLANLTRELGSGEK